MSIAGSLFDIYKPQGDSTVAFFATTASERKRFKFVQLNSMTIFPGVTWGYHNLWHPQISSYPRMFMPISCGLKEKNGAEGYRNRSFEKRQDTEP
jgi:hypothetical protein